MLKFLQREHNFYKQIPKLQCNCMKHKTCKFDGQKCSCPFFYVYKVSKRYIKDWDIYPFFCTQCVNNLKKQKIHFEEIAVTTLFQEYMMYKTYSQQYILPYLAMQLGQPIFKNVRLTKCVKQILKTIKNKYNMYEDQILSDFAFYCKKRTILRKLAQKNGVFHSQIIQEKSLDLQQLMKKNLFNPKQDAISKIPLPIKKDEFQYYFCYKDKFVITAYQSKQNININLFDLLSGKSKDQIEIQYENFAYFKNVQIQISENLQYLVAMINNSTLIIYDLVQKSYQTKKFEYQLNFCNMFLGNDKLFIVTETFFTGYKFPNVEPIIEFCFPYFIDDYFNIGGQYNQSKNEFAFLLLEGLYFIKIDTLEMTQVKRFKLIKDEYPNFDNQFQIIDTNNLLIFIRFNDLYAQLVIRSLLKSKIIRKFTFKIKYPTIHKLSLVNVQTYLLQKSTKLVIIQHDQVTILNLMTGRKELRLKFQNVQNQVDRRKSIQISDEKFFLVAENNQIIVNKFEQ